jgi:DNA-binding phage protein
MPKFLSPDHVCESDRIFLTRAREALIKKYRHLSKAARIYGISREKLSYMLHGRVKLSQDIRAKMEADLHG